MLHTFAPQVWHYVFAASLTVNVSVAPSQLLGDVDSLDKPEFVAAKVVGTGGAWTGRSGWRSCRTWHAHTRAGTCPSALFVGRKNTKILSYRHSMHDDTYAVLVFLVRPKNTCTY